VEPGSGDDKPHLPAPSLWPVGFAVGIACLLVGIVVDWKVAAVGAGIAIVFAFLWVRDLMRRHETTLGAEPEAPEAPVGTEPPIPANEGEAAMPLPAPGETFPRSKFLEGATLGLGAVIGAAVTVPAVGFMVVPAFVDQGRDDVELGPLSEFPENKWIIATFLLKPEDGEVSRRTAYVRNNGLLEGVPSFTILSNRCVHLGCPVQPGGLILDDEAKTTQEKGQEVRLVPMLPANWGCPCHGGSYDLEGNRIAGPPVRALDRYEFAVRDGKLYLGKSFSVSDVEGTGAQARMRTYPLAGPGQHVDGVESWLYPLQPPS
jgi:menaquinol-cytochrome c reductase iron-sulfur subunit